MSVGKEWEIPLRQTKKVLSGELFLGVIALQTPIQKNHYLREMDPYPRYCHIYLFIYSFIHSLLFVCFHDIQD